MSAADALARAQALRRDGRLTEAATVLREFVRSPDVAIADLYTCGKRLQDLGQFSDALTCFNRVLAGQPDNIGCLVNASIAARSSGRADDALAIADRATTLAPGLSVARVSRAEALLTLGRAEEALTSCNKLLDEAPFDADAHLTLGRALRALGRRQDALVAIDRAVALAPGLLRAQIAKGYLAHELGRVTDAIAAFRKALEIDPDHHHVLGMLGYSLLRMGDWPDLEFIIPGITAALEEGRLAALPFELAHVVDDPALMLRSAQLYAAEIAARAPLPATPLSPGDRRKIRIAYLSPDFREHAVSYLAAGLLEKHDRSRFEIIGVALTRPTGDATQRRIAEACTTFIDASTMSDRTAVDRLRGLGLDIAVDLAGHTDGARPEALAARIAPVQVNFLGYPGTTGAPWSDYIIADGIVIPPGAEAHYSEQIVRMPGCYQVNDDARPLDPPAPTRLDAGLPAAGLVLACFNGVQKITPTLFECWMRILRAAPGSVLWLLAAAEAAMTALRRSAAARGVDPARIIFAPPRPHAEHMARHRLVDLCLDTTPYSAHTAASDSLWSGVPLVALQGQNFAARVSSSILTAARCPELITTSIGDYEALVTELTRNAEALGSATSKVRAARRSSPLFDTDRYRQQLESAYQRMLAIARRGDVPQGFTVEG